MATVTGQEQLLNNLSQFEQKTVKKIYQAVATMQAIVINDARILVPVRTANLLKSIQAGVVTIEDDGVVAEIKAEAEYASYVELGTSRQKAQPYLIPAIMRNEKTFLRAVGEAFKP